MVAGVLEVAAFEEHVGEQSGLGAEGVHVEVAVGEGDVGGCLARCAAFFWEGRVGTRGGFGGEG